MTRPKSKLIMQSLVLTLLLVCSYAQAAEYYVSAESGDDSANGLSEGTAWKTIQKAADSAGPGDTVHVMAGTYTERGRADGGSSDESYLGIEPKNSGNSDAPIVFQGQPGAIIDQNREANGFYIEARDYITIKGFEINDVKSGIVTKPKGNGEEILGIIIEDNHIYNAYGNPGDNVSLVRLDSCENCVVRNNFLHHAVIGDGSSSDQQNTGGVLSYGMQNATIINNEIHSVYSGVYHKRFTTSDGTRGSVIENNVIRDVSVGVRYSISGGGDLGHMGQMVRFNVFYNVSVSCIGSDLSETGTQSTGLQVFNNTFDGCGVGFNGIKNVEIYNNIFYEVDNARAISTSRANSEGTGFPPSILYSNHNIFYPDATFGLDLNAGDHKYSSLSQWRSVNTAFTGGFEASSPTLPPDANSLTQNPQLVSASTHNYRVAAASVAHVDQGRGRNGSGIGAYPSGDEIIGLLPSDNPATIVDLEYQSGE